jgi:hypothetical protein
MRTPAGAGSDCEEEAMTDLVEPVIDAHAGLECWKQLDAVSVHGVNGGALRALKGQALTRSSSRSMSATSGSPTRRSPTAQQQKGW